MAEEAQNHNLKHTRGSTRLSENKTGDRGISRQSYRIRTDSEINNEIRHTSRQGFRNIQLGNLGVVAGEDAVTDGEAGVGSDDTIVGAGDGHARAAVVLVRVEPRHRLCSRDSLMPHALAMLLVWSGGGLISSENSEAR